MSEQKTNRWQAISAITSMLQVILLTLSLFFIASQLRTQIRLSKAANTQAFVNQLTPVDLRVTDPEISTLWLNGKEGIDQNRRPSVKEIQENQYETLLATYLTFYENIYWQHEKELLDPEIFQAWDNDLASFVAEHKIGEDWDQWRCMYHKSFSDHVYGIIRETKPNAGANPPPCPRPQL